MAVKWGSFGTNHLHKEWVIRALRAGKMSSVKNPRLSVQKMQKKCLMPFLNR